MRTIMPQAGKFVTRSYVNAAGKRDQRLGKH
jgi:hypothetical protein